jgi:hypothetical protein
MPFVRGQEPGEEDVHLRILRGIQIQVIVRQFRIGLRRLRFIKLFVMFIVFQPYIARGRFVFPAASPGTSTLPQ